MGTIRKHLPFAILVIALIVFAYRFQKPTIGKMPQNTHTWAQCDRWALSMGFLRNGFNFFMPETYVYNKQFPNDFKVASSNTVTAADFPIHDYIPALIMKITGHPSPIWFRLYILLYSFIGLFFLFKLAFAWTEDRWWALFVTLFASLSPVFVFYQGNFLPTIPSLANAIVGLYFYLNYIQKSKIKWLFWATAFLTLSALSRLPFAIYLVAIVGIEILSFIRKRKITWQPTLNFCLVFALIGGYFFYNRYLNHKYGSMFLGHPLPPQGWADTMDIIRQSLSNWKFQYFSKVQYILLVLVFLFALVAYFIKPQKANNPFILMVLLSIIGVIIYASLMLVQFVNHDYYFLETFYLPVILIVVLSGKALTLLNPLKYALLMIILFGGLIVALKSVQIAQQKRWIIADYDDTAKCRQAYANSDSLLNKYGLGRDSRILVLAPQAPNLPFCLMNRKGYAVMNSDSGNIHQALQWDYDAIAVANNFLFSDVIQTYPSFTREVRFLGTNGRLSIFGKQKPEKDSVCIEQFLGIDRIPSVLELNLLKSPEFGKRTNLKWVENPIGKGDSVGYTSSSDEFGITYKYLSDGKVKPSLGLVSVTGDFYFNSDLQNVLIIVSVNNDGHTKYYDNRSLADFVSKPDQWQQCKIYFWPGEQLKPDSEWCVYIWNPGHKAFYYRNFEIKVY
jgi:hypothetical protein